MIAELGPQGPYRAVTRAHPAGLIRANSGWSRAVDEPEIEAAVLSQDEQAYLNKRTVPLKIVIPHSALETWAAARPCRYFLLLKAACITLPVTALVLWLVNAAFFRVSGCVSAANLDAVVAGIVGGIAALITCFWNLDTEAARNVAYCSDLYNDMGKHTDIDRMWVNACNLASDLLAFNLWAHPMFASVFKGIIEEALKHAPTNFTSRRKDGRLTKDGARFLVAKLMSHHNAIVSDGMRSAGACCHPDGASLATLAQRAKRRCCCGHRPETGSS